MRILEMFKKAGHYRDPNSPEFIANVCDLEELLEAALYCLDKQIKNRGFIFLPSEPERDLSVAMFEEIKKSLPKNSYLDNNNGWAWVLTMISIGDIDPITREVAYGKFYRCNGIDTSPIKRETNFTKSLEIIELREWGKGYDPEDPPLTSYVKLKDLLRILKNMTDRGFLESSRNERDLKNRDTKYGSNDGLSLIVQERQKQLKYNFDDSKHTGGELLDVAMCYIDKSLSRCSNSWPHDSYIKLPLNWESMSKIEALKIAGSLIAAEIDRRISRDSETERVQDRINHAVNKWLNFGKNNVYDWMLSSVEEYTTPEFSKEFIKSVWDEITEWAKGTDKTFEFESDHGWVNFSVNMVSENE